MFDRAKGSETRRADCEPAVEAARKWIVEHGRYHQQHQLKVRGLPQRELPAAQRPPHALLPYLDRPPLR